MCIYQIYQLFAGESEVLGGGGGGQGSENLAPRGGGGKLFAGCKLTGASAPNQCQIIYISN